MGTLEKIAKSATGQAFDQLKSPQGVVDSLDKARVDAAPLERSLMGYRLLKAAIGLSILTLILCVATSWLMTAGSYLAATISALFTIGVIFATLRSFHGLKLGRQILSDWPIELAEANPGGYGQAVADVSSKLIRWDTPMLACWSLAALVGAGWAGASGELGLAAGIVVFAIAMVVLAKDARAKADITQRGLAHKRLEGSTSEVVKGVRAVNALAGESSASAPHRPEVRVSDTEKIVCRGPIAKTGLAGMRSTGGDGVERERAPQDVLVVTDRGIHMINVMEPPQPWDGLGGGLQTSAAKAEFVKEALDGVESWKDLIDIAGVKLDKLVTTHGYPAVVSADPRNIVYLRGNIMSAAVRKRRIIPSYYFQVTLVDGTIDKWDVQTGKDKLNELKAVLAEQEYPTGS